MTPNHPRKPRAARPGQAGFVMIEALVAILIFSIGILGVVGLQATAVQQSSDARYRAQAAELAQQLLGQMWTGDRSASVLQTQYNCAPACTSAGAGYTAWYSQVVAALPGVSADINLKPYVSIDDTGVVHLTIYWRQPSDDPGTSHQYKVDSQIGQ